MQAESNIYFVVWSVLIECSSFDHFPIVLTNIHYVYSALLLYATVNVSLQLHTLTHSLNKDAVLYYSSCKGTRIMSHMLN